MQTIEEALSFVVGELSDKNYALSLNFYRFWFETGGTHLEIPSDQILNAIWNYRGAASSINTTDGRIFHASAHRILRFASDAESDRILAPYCSGLQSRLCAKALREFSSNNLIIARYGGNTEDIFYADVNLIAHWANLGFVEEAVIRDYILQSLVSHPKLYSHQAYALIILFKLAGATFEAYVDPSVVDLCFEYLKIHSAVYTPEYGNRSKAHAERKKNIQVRMTCASKGGHQTKMNSREPFKR